MEEKLFLNIVDVASCDEKIGDFFSAFVTSSTNLLVVRSPIVIFTFLYVLWITI